MYTLTLIVITELLKHSRGRYTQEQVSRVSRMAGPFARQLDTIYENQVSETYVQDTHKERSVHYRRNIPEFINEYQDAGLFDCVPGRQHAHFPKYRLDRGIPNPAKFRSFMEKYFQEH